MGKHEEIKRNKRKRKNRSKVFVFILIVLAILGALFAKRVHDLDGNWIAALLGHNKNTLENLDKLNILVMGESQGMSDTIIICSYDPKTQNASMLSIPRDTFIGDSRYSASVYDKINSVYNGSKDPQKTLKEVNELTGLDIKNYVLIDTKALVELVDVIGGVEFNVPMDMKYDDYSQDLHVDLKEGWQKLNGSQVEQVVRFRHNNDGSTYSYEYGIEDFGRMRTQREVIVAIAKQTIKFKNVKEIGNILDISERYVKTNMNFGSLKDYIPYIIEMNTENIKTKQLPGQADYLNGISFFLPDEEKTKETIDELFRGIIPEEITEQQ
jgi:LCP family protein required for cell wall assembly